MAMSLHYPGLVQLHNFPSPAVYLCTAQQLCDVGTALKVTVTSRELPEQDEP